MEAREARGGMVPGSVEYKIHITGVRTTRSHPVGPGLIQHGPFVPQSESCLQPQFTPLHTPAMASGLHGPLEPQSEDPQHAHCVFPVHTLPPGGLSMQGPDAPQSLHTAHTVSVERLN